jgi:hypothetical protein
LDHIEIGNEPDLYARKGTRGKNYSIRSWVTEYIFPILHSLCSSRHCTKSGGINLHAISLRKQGYMTIPKHSFSVPHLLSLLTPVGSPHGMLSKVVYLPELPGRRSQRKYLKERVPFFLYLSPHVVLEYLSIITTALSAPASRVVWMLFCQSQIFETI